MVFPFPRSRNHYPQPLPAMTPLQGKWFVLAGHPEVLYAGLHPSAYLPVLAPSIRSDLTRYVLPVIRHLSGVRHRTHRSVHAPGQRRTRGHARTEEDCSGSRADSRSKLANIHGHLRADPPRFRRKGNHQCAASGRGVPPASAPKAVQSWRRNVDVVKNISHVAGSSRPHRRLVLVGPDPTGVSGQEHPVMTGTLTPFTAPERDTRGQRRTPVAPQPEAPTARVDRRRSGCGS